MGMEEAEAKSPEEWAPTLPPPGPQLLSGGQQVLPVWRASQ